MQGEGQHLMNAINGIMNRAIDAAAIPAKPAVVRESDLLPGEDVTDAIRRIFRSSCKVTIGKHGERELYSGITSIVVTVARDHFSEGWYFDDRISVVAYDRPYQTFADFKFIRVDNTDAGHELRYERAWAQSRTPPVHQPSIQEFSKWHCEASYRQTVSSD